MKENGIIEVILCIKTKCLHNKNFLCNFFRTSYSKSNRCHIYEIMCAFHVCIALHCIERKENLTKHKTQTNEPKFHICFAKHAIVIYFHDSFSQEKNDATGIHQIVNFVICNVFFTCTLCSVSLCFSSVLNCSSLR